MIASSVKMSTKTMLMTSSGVSNVLGCMYQNKLSTTVLPMMQYMRKLSNLLSSTSEMQQLLSEVVYSFVSGLPLGWLFKHIS